MNQTILRAKAFVVSWISFPNAWKVYLPQWLEITYKKELKNNKTKLTYGEIFSQSQVIGIPLFCILLFWLHVSKNTTPKKVGLLECFLTLEKTVIMWVMFWDQEFCFRDSCDAFWSAVYKKMRWTPNKIEGILGDLEILSTSQKQQKLLERYTLHFQALKRYSMIAKFRYFSLGGHVLSL